MFYNVSINGDIAGEVTVDVNLDPVLQTLGVSLESVLLTMSEGRPQCWQSARGEVTVSQTKVGFLVAVDGQRAGLLQLNIDIPTVLQARHQVTEVTVRKAIITGQAQQWFCMGDVRIEDASLLMDMSPSM
jgi:hypothetical protein